MENRLELFNKTCNTLIDAWMKGGLLHGDCSACAVGNICGGQTDWSIRFMTTSNGVQIFDRMPDFFDERDREIADFLIASTGYTTKELARIEYAFEISIADDREALFGTPEGQYIGLCAVMDVLWDIHGIEDKSLTALNAAAVAKGVEVNA